MQRLKRPKWLSRNSSGPLDDASRTRRELRWGILTLVALLVLAGAVAVVSTVRTGVSTYTAFLTDTASLRTGDDVRVAGITVGAVKALDLQADRVRMSFTVDSTVFVGQESTLDVRMLTIVGGHYVALLPAGNKPLGRQVIPADRVTLPYNLTRLFQDAIAPAEQIDGDTLRKNFGALAAAVDGSPDGFRRMLTALDTVTGILDKQNADVSQALSVSDEYLTALAANKSVVGKLIAKFRILETLVADNRVAVGQSLDNLATVLEQTAPVARLWSTQLAPLAQPIADALPQLRTLTEQLGALLDSLRAFGTRLQTLASPQGLAVDQSAGTISAPALCIPIPGRGC